ncbi:MAG: DUF4434 domain-containing protein [Limnochordaceae bacterium]|nr:DUF4434 domain-containing protein [Limnochordaceae bacterium]
MQSRGAQQYKPGRAIHGTWLDFHHPNYREGDYWNDTTAQFTPEDWDAKIGEMIEAGMRHLVIMSVALRGRSFYPSQVIPERWPLKTEDPIEAVLRAADARGGRVYLGVGFFHEDTGRFLQDPEGESVQRSVCSELAQRYASHPSFAGWYLPVEAGVQGHFPDGYIEYTNTLGGICRRAADQPVFIAPYGTRLIKPDDRFVEQLRQLEVDWLAWQDEVGVRKTRVDELPEIYERLVRTHQAAGRRLWMDIEIFVHEGEVYKSPLIPAPWERVRAQLEAIPLEVEEVLCYQYLGMMNKPGSPVFAGHPTSSALYASYRAWRQQLEEG